MSIKIKYTNTSATKPSSNIVLFCGNEYKISYLKKYLSKTELSYISDILKTSDLKKSFLSFNINSKKKVILISLKKDAKLFDVENIGADFVE